MIVIAIAFVSVLQLILIQKGVTKKQSYVRIGCEQNLRLWTLHSLFSGLSLVLYVAFGTEHITGVTKGFGKWIYLGAWVLALLFVEFLSPSRQLWHIFRKTPEEKQEQLHEIEESYDRFYQFFGRVLLWILVGMGVVRLGIYFLLERGTKKSVVSGGQISACLEDVVGVGILLISCLSVRQLVTQLSLTKRGYFRQDFFQKLRKKDEIQERLRARHRKL